MDILINFLWNDCEKEFLTDIFPDEEFYTRTLLNIFYNFLTDIRNVLYLFYRTNLC